jgi:predicted Ser/Thr protein kinase
MDIQEIDRYCDLFEQLLKEGAPLSVEQFLDERHLPADAELAAELKKVAQECRANTCGAAGPGESVASTDPQAVTEVYRNERSAAHRHAEIGRPRLAASPESGQLPERIGRYRIVALLGSGGQSIVYRAVHPELEQEVVIKVSRAGGRGFDGEALRSEGRLLASLDHPHVARVYDLDVTGGRPFLVMEFVRGRTLAQFARDEKPDPRTVATLLAKVARALTTAHRLGVAHLDIKPANLLIDDRGEPRIIDFGLARCRSIWTPDAAEADVISGTIPFMAPEQARGDTKQIGPRSDIFALGAVLYWLLTGRAPFEDQTAARALAKARRGDFDSEQLRAAAAPKRLKAACITALQAEPERRFRSAEELAIALEQIAAPRPSRAVLLAAASLLVCFVVIWIIGTGHENRSSARTDAAPAGIHEPRLEIEVWRNDVARALADAVPLVSGDDLRIVCDAPPGHQPLLYWLDTEGVLHELPLENETTGGDPRRRYWPAPGKSRVLEGPPGTEIVFMGTTSGTPPVIEELRKLVAEATSDNTLTTSGVIVFDSAATRSITDRRPGSAEIVREHETAIERIDRLRVALLTRFGAVAGVAFEHGSKP